MDEYAEGERTKQNLIVRSGELEAVVTKNNRILYEPALCIIGKPYPYFFFCILTCFMCCFYFEFVSGSILRIFMDFTTLPSSPLPSHLLPSP